jgi:hypothetical protein
MNNAQQLLAFLDKAGTFNENDANQQQAILKLIMGAAKTRSYIIGSVGTLTPDVDVIDLYTITAQAEAITIANPTGSPVEGDGFVVKIKDNATARAISFGSDFRAIGVDLPTTTTESKLMYIVSVWNSIDSKWDVINITQEV